MKALVPPARRQVRSGFVLASDHRRQIRSCRGTLSGMRRYRGKSTEEDNMGFGKGALLWLIGVPLPIILLLAVFWHH
jgi:hypothetical protein